MLIDKLLVTILISSVTYHVFLESSYDIGCLSKRDF